MDPTRVHNLFNLGLFNIKLGLENIRYLLSHLNNPHEHPRIIHIAGTNGKGSTLAFLERLLLDSGFSTGSTISPHIICFNERFRINGKAVDDGVLEKAYLEVCRACKLHPDLSPDSLEKGLVRPTFFEFSIAMAFIIFREFSVDYILLETGLGGRLDATNVIEQSLISVISRIALDHQYMLGQTLEEITAEKLGVLKPGRPVIAACQEEKALDLIRQTCRKKGNTLYYYSRHFHIVDSGPDEVFGTFDFGGLNTEINGMLPNSLITITESSLIGEYQKENLATALAAYFYLMFIERKQDAFKEVYSLQQLNWRGRLEYLPGRDDVLIDCAHNASGMESLTKYLAENHADKQILFALSWTRDHDFISVFKENLLKNLIFLPIQMSSERAENINSVSQSLKISDYQVLSPIDVESLVENVRNHALVSHDLLVITGSLYLIGEFLAKWEGSEATV